jgi:hypothetical protein
MKKKNKKNTAIGPESVDDKNDSDKEDNKKRKIHALVSGTFRWSIVWNVCSPTLGMRNWYVGILRSVGKIMRRFGTLQMELSGIFLIFNINHLDQKVEI